MSAATSTAERQERVALLRERPLVGTKLVGLRHETRDVGSGVGESLAGRGDLALRTLDLVDAPAACPFELRQALLAAGQRRSRLGLVDPCVGEAARLLVALGRKPLERGANLGGARPHRGRALLETARRVELAGDRLVAPLELRGVGEQRSVGCHARILAARAAGRSPVRTLVP